MSAAGEMMFGIFIGFFQPVVRGDVEKLREELRRCKRVAVIFQSAHSIRTLRSPFTVSERKEMLAASLSSEELKQVVMLEIEDRFYDPERWLKELYQMLTAAAGAADEWVIYGMRRDARAHEWSRDLWEKAFAKDDASVRAGYLRDSQSKKKEVPPEVADWLDKFSLTKTYKDLAKEQKANDDYRKSWSGAPFPPIFVTTDALVTYNDQVLLIRRGHAPGVGQLALPGGFLEADELIETGILRELSEETNFKVANEDLRQWIKSKHVFDHPLRAARGRTITHVAHIAIPPSAPAPSFQAGDDAAEAFWFPIKDLEPKRAEFFDDHYQVIDAVLRDDGF